jgi:hypothetical protein
MWLFVCDYNGCSPPQGPPNDTLLNPPSAPVLLNPPNDTTIYFESDFPHTIVLTWTTVEDAEEYQIQVSGDSLFTGAPSITKTTNSCEYVISANGRYFWHVSAYNYDWKWYTSWSEAWIFSTYYAPF